MSHTNSKQFIFWNCLLTDSLKNVTDDAGMKVRIGWVFIQSCGIPGICGIGMVKETCHACYYFFLWCEDNKTKASVWLNLTRDKPLLQWDLCVLDCWGDAFVPPDSLKEIQWIKARTSFCQATERDAAMPHYYYERLPLKAVKKQKTKSVL